MDLVAPMQMPRNNGEMVQYGDDSGLYVEFYTDAFENEWKTLETGHKTFDTCEMIRIQPKGQNKTVVVQKVEEMHKRRFPRQYEQFQRQEQQVSSGMPVTEWAAIAKSQALELKAMGIHTVEDLCIVPDDAMMNMMGGFALREKARTWIASATDASVVLKIQAENEQLKADMKALMDQVKNFTGQQLQEPVHAPVSMDTHMNQPKRGRPAKNGN